MQIRKGKIVFNSLLLGSGTIGVKTYEETVNGLRANGYQYTGYVQPNSMPDNMNIATVHAWAIPTRLEEIVDQEEYPAGCYCPGKK